MGGSEQIRVSSWPFSNPAHQREHPAPAGSWHTGEWQQEFGRFSEMCSPSPELSELTAGKNQQKLNDISEPLNNLTFMEPLDLRSSSTVALVLPVFFFCSCLGSFHNTSLQLIDTFSKLNYNLWGLANKIFGDVCNKGQIFPDSGSIRLLLLLLFVFSSTTFELLSMCHALLTSQSWMSTYWPLMVRCKTWGSHRRAGAAPPFSFLPTPSKPTAKMVRKTQLVQNHLIIVRFCFCPISVVFLPTEHLLLVDVFAVFYATLMRMVRFNIFRNVLTHYLSGSILHSLACINYGV